MHDIDLIGFKYELKKNLCTNWKKLLEYGNFTIKTIGEMDMCFIFTSNPCMRKCMTYIQDVTYAIHVEDATKELTLCSSAFMHKPCKTRKHLVYT